MYITKLNKYWKVKKQNEKWTKYTAKGTEKRHNKTHFNLCRTVLEKRTGKGKQIATKSKSGSNTSASWVNSCFCIFTFSKNKPMNCEYK